MYYCSKAVGAKASPILHLPSASRTTLKPQAFEPRTLPGTLQLFRQVPANPKTPKERAQAWKTSLPAGRAAQSINRLSGINNIKSTVVTMAIV